MFDTITLDPSIRCPECGALVASHQTKEFDCLMSYYRIGSVVPSSCHSGIIRDQFWCGPARMPTGSLSARSIL